MPLKLTFAKAELHIPILMLQFLTDGKYNADTGEYITASGNKRFYFASDNVSSEKYKGLTPHDLIDIAMFHSLMYSNTYG